MKLFRFEGVFKVDIRHVNPKAIFVKVKELSETIPMSQETSNQNMWVQFLMQKQQQVRQYLSKVKFR